MNLLAHRPTGTRSLAPLPFAGRCKKTGGWRCPTTRYPRARRLLLHRLAHRLHILAGQGLIFVMRSRITGRKSGAVFATDATCLRHGGGNRVRCTR